MKKMIVISLAITSICISAFATTRDEIHSKPCETYPNLYTINVCHLTDVDLNEIMQGRRPEVAIEFAAETVLPIGFFAKGNLITLDEKNCCEIEIKDTFYLRCVQDELILSTNLIDWKPFFEFVTGNASMALNIKEGRPSIVFGTEMNQRS